MSQVGDKLIGSLKDIYSKVSFEVQRSYQVNRLRVEIASARREQERLFKALGERVYKASKQGGSDEDGPKDQIAALDRLRAQIAAKEGEIDELNSRSAPEPPTGWAGQRET